MIWDDGKYYVLEDSPSQKKCFFDRDNRALEAVCRAIKRDGSFTPTERKTFHVQPNKGRKKYYISQLLYGAYHNKPLSWVRNGRVNFNDRNCYNLTKANLSHTHADEADNINRRIWREGDYIFLYHKRSRKCFFCDYEAELFKLLCNHRIMWGYQPKSGRLGATVIKKKRKMCNIAFGFHSLVYAFHHYGARRNNFVGAIRRMQKDFRKHDLSIDHLDNRQENNLRWNLSPMPCAQNSGKRDMLGRIKYPFFVFAVYCDGIYKIACGRVYEEIPPQFDIAFIACESSNTLISFLKSFLEMSWPDGLSPAINLKNNPDAVCLHTYFGDFGATTIRTMLLLKSRQEFVAWPSSHETDNSNEKTEMEGCR